MHVFFFKQKTAYEIQYGLVGSEMCIRDRDKISDATVEILKPVYNGDSHKKVDIAILAEGYTCLLYTSDAADERSSVDLGGRRIIKKKKRRQDICRLIQYIN